MVKLRNVTVVYPGAADQRSDAERTPAIDNIDLTVSEGESIAVIGGNGAGKTTLLLAMVGILETSKGTIEIDGIRLEKKTLNEIRKRTGLVFQNPDDQLFMPLIYDDIAFGSRNIGLPEGTVEKRVDETLNRLKITHLRKRSSLKLSAGEKRMAAIATVLAMEPSVLLFDEPTAFLDPKARRSLIETLNTLHHTKIVATHDLAFAAETCGRLIILKSGRIAADGAIPLLYDRELMSHCDLEAIEDASLHLWT